MSIDTTTQADAPIHTEQHTKAKSAPRKRKKAAPKTFKAAYDILKNNAAELQQQDEPDIDNLMTTVEQSIAAYRVCETRINAVQQALDAAFAEDSDNIVDTN